MKEAKTRARESRRPVNPILHYSTLYDVVPDLFKSLVLT